MSMSLADCLCVRVRDEAGAGDAQFRVVGEGSEVDRQGAGGGIAMDLMEVVRVFIRTPYAGVVVTVE